ncbi:hypothetical protein PPROV_000208400 [Pycnococcus provasolii]|uniref:Uncharacterized protein n=1 Tax=Pycnococcus provasolii TaxID=41880 RepID=A0A830HDA7_9CHLO|nr:hypothetical protein PPROV_000208400 [Pycnococcus provasolii]
MASSMSNTAPFPSLQQRRGNDNELEFEEKEGDGKTPELWIGYHAKFSLKRDCGRSNAKVPHAVTRTRFVVSRT